MAAHPAPSASGLRARAAAWAILAALLVLGAIPAQAGQWRVFIQAQDRQLRSLVLEASGVSNLPEDSPESAHYEAALADARTNALETARLTLESEIAARNPAVRVEFPVLGEKPEDSVFVHSVDVLAPAQGSPYQVLIMAEVVYVVLMPAEDAVLSGDQAEAPGTLGMDDADQLPLTPPDSGEAAQAAQGVDQDSMQQGYESLTRALEERLRELLEE